MKKMKGFTLIELLIVVAIIAILAAIAVPNFLEAQIRSKVSRVYSDMRSLATAIEAYYVDANDYPAMGRGATGIFFAASNKTGETDNLDTFRVWTNGLMTLTTPVAYITSFMNDPFADADIGFTYYKDTNGWILGSFGPDTDEGVAGDLQWKLGGNVETVYTSRESQPSQLLIGGSSLNSPAGANAFTYDTTNGTVSDGDLYRVKQ